MKLAVKALLTLVLVAAVTPHAHTADPDELTAEQIFENRIMPIFQSDEPSSCVQCHLSSVDLKDYILPSHTETFLSLRDNGLVNVESPDESKILKLIRMGHQDADRGARLIHEKMRKAELAAFSSWIDACCSDPKLRQRPAEKQTAIGPVKPMEVVRHARKSRVVDSFARNVWSQRMRCFPCHTPHEIQDDNPKHKLVRKRHGEFVEKYGLKMNIFGKTPEQTMDGLIASSRRRIPGRLPLLNLEDPAHSLLLLKPTSKVPTKDDSGNFAKPSSKIPVSHMGGLKMHVNDQSYKSFITWIQDYANVVDGQYTTVDELPADNWIPTQRVLRIRDVPESWGHLTPVQLFVFGRDQESDGWADLPIAFTQGLTTPRRIVNGALLLLRSDDGPVVAADSDSFPLRPGRHLIKVYLDRHGRIAESPSVMLTDDDFVGQAEIVAHWRVGFKNADVFSAELLR